LKENLQILELIEHSWLYFLSNIHENSIRGRFCLPEAAGMLGFSQALVVLDPRFAASEDKKEDACFRPFV
jgi:hypothetical protein